MPALLSCGIPIVEDCAQAHGAILNGRRAGSWGSAGCFSFYPTKNLGALGDGGAVVTTSSETAQRVRALRQYGWTSKYISELAGGRNSRMDAIQAAILRAKLLTSIAGMNAGGNLPAFITVLLSRAPWILLSSPTCSHSQYKTGRDSDPFETRGIATDVHCPIPDHRHPSISLPTCLPVTDQLCAEVLTLPLFPEMTDSEVDRVIKAVIETGSAADESL